MMANVPPALDVFVRFLRLGLTSFGGPIAHIGYFRREFVDRARWLDDASYGEIVALCSVLPGPTSSQVGMVLGARRAGALGGLLAWVGFTAPSALVMTALGIGGAALRSALVVRALAGLECVAVAVILAAVVAMARTLLRSPFGYAAAATALAATLALAPHFPSLTWLVLVVAGIVAAFAAPPAAMPGGGVLRGGSRALAVAAAIALAFGLLAVPALARLGAEPVALFAVVFRAGALVFGGGHVVLPFLETLVDARRLDESRFLAGYAAAQAVPGPLFTFAAFLGAADVRMAAMPLLGAAIALGGIFAPSALLLAIAAPLWNRIRAFPRAARVLTGLNAAVVGILAAVLIDPVALHVARLPLGAAVPIAAGAFLLLQVAKAPSWAVVASGALAGMAAFGAAHLAA